MLRRRLILALLVAAVTLAAAAPVRAQSVGLDVAPASAPFGGEIAITASGEGADSGLRAFVVPGGSCASTLNAQYDTFSTQTGWEFDGTNTLRYHLQGPFSATWYLTPTYAGPFAVCAYLSTGDSETTASALLSVAPAQATLQPPTGAVTFFHPEPGVTATKLAVTVAGQSSGILHLPVYAIRDGKTCNPGDDSAIKLTPDAGVAKNESGTAIVGPGPFSVHLSAVGPTVPLSFSGNASFLVCTSAGRELEQVNTKSGTGGATEPMGPDFIQAFTVTAAQAVVSGNLPALKPRIIGLHVFHWTHPRVTTMDVTFRGCHNDKHTFNSLRVNRRSRRFDLKLRFADKTKGTLRGRFNSRWRSVKGKLKMSNCAFSFTRKGKFR